MANTSLFRLFRQRFKGKRKSTRGDDLDEVKLFHVFQDFIDDVIKDNPNLHSFTIEVTKEEDRATLVNLIDSQPWPGVTVSQETESIYKVQLDAIEDSFDEEF